MTKRSSILFCVVVLVQALWGQSSPSTDTYVAKAGEVFISEGEFLQRFELLPAFGRQRRSQLEAAKVELLYSMIAEKLLAQEAVSRNLDQDTLIRRAMAEIRKMLARDALYRQEIIEKVRVSPQETKRGIAQARKELFLTYLYFENKDGAEFVRRQFQRPGDFDMFQIDSSMGAIRDTVTLTWGNAEPAIEEAAYDLALGEVSPVVMQGNGYYILKLTEIHKSDYYSSMQLEVLRERVTETLRLRAEKVRFDAYLHEALEHKVAYALPRTFRVLLDSLMAALRSLPETTGSYLDQSTIENVRLRCREFLADTLVVVGSDHWTLGEILDRLSLKSFPLNSDNSPVIPHQLNTQIQVWAQQELLAQEALRRGLDLSPDVSRHMDMWRDYYLAEAMKELVRRDVTVSESDIWESLQSRDPSVAVPCVQIRELLTQRIDDMREALAQLEKGRPFDQVVGEWSVDPAARSRGGLSEFFPITERPPIGEIAWRMRVGEKYGPVTMSNGILLFELVAKKSTPPADTSFEARKKAAAGELLAQKRQRRLSLFLAQVAEQRGFALYGDRLRAISVTPVPMMTYRVLGFGGRIFAAPFVEKQLDWLSIEPPSTKIVP
jgi:parvulin-like peptidyl-prolyl isomerase